MESLSGEVLEHAEDQGSVLAAAGGDGAFVVEVAEEGVAVGDVGGEVGEGGWGDGECAESLASGAGSIRRTGSILAPPRVSLRGPGRLGVGVSIAAPRLWGCLVVCAYRNAQCYDRRI